MKRSISYVMIGVIVVAAAAGSLERRDVLRQEQDLTRLRTAATAARLEWLTQQQAAKRDVEGARENAKAEANRATSKLVPDSGDPNYDKRMRTLVRKMHALRHWMEHTPGEMVPELQFVDDAEWLSEAHGIAHVTDVRELQSASRQLKRQGQFGLMAIFRSALRSYVRDSGGQLPVNLADLRPYCVCPIDDAIWARYEMAASGTFEKLQSGQPVFAERMSSEELKYAETV